MSKQPYFQGAGQPPYPYPTTVMPKTPKPPIPQTVQRAFYGMLVGAALEVVGVVLTLTETSRIKSDLIARRSDATPDQINTLVNFTIGAAVFGGLITVGLWIWMALANRTGHHWARIVATVFFGISTFSVVADLVLSSVSTFNTSAGSSPLMKTVTVVGWAVGVFIIVMLWHKKSGPYFQPPTPIQGYPYPYAGGYPGGYPSGQPGVLGDPAPYGTPQPPPNPWDVNPPQQPPQQPPSA